MKTFLLGGIKRWLNLIINCFLSERSTSYRSEREAAWEKQLTKSSQKLLRIFDYYQIHGFAQWSSSFLTLRINPCKLN